MYTAIMRMYYHGAMLMVVLLLPSVFCMEFTPVPSSLSSSLSQVCHQTGENARSIVEQALSCSRSDECRGFRGLPGARTDELQCTCMEEPIMGSNFTPAVTAELTLIVFSPIKKKTILRLEMDEMWGSILKGSINGTVVGGASLTTGKIDSALLTDGNSQYVTYGMQEDQCFANPQICNKGLTYSFWAKILSVGTSSFSSIIMESGAFNGNLGFYVVHFTSEMAITISVKTNTTQFRYDSWRGSWHPGNWVHVVFVWSSTDGLSVYINGCPAAQNRNGVPRSSSGFNSFNIGASSSGYNKAHMKIDHVLVWDETLKAEEVWQLYMQIGIV